LTAKSRYQKLSEQYQLSTDQAIQTARQAHVAVEQAQSSLLPQDIQYAEKKVYEALHSVRHIQNNLNIDLSSDIQASLKEEEAKLIQEYQMFN
jgi:hypothetical protein